MADGGRNPADHDVGNGEGHGDGGVWVTVAEAARRLGVTPTAIRNRLDRGTLESRPHGNRGRLVRLPDGVRHGDDTGFDPQGLTGAARAAVTIARLEERLAAAMDARRQVEVLRDTFHERVEELRAELARERQQREAVERTLAERDRLIDQALKELGELREERRRRPWPGLRAWWWRFIKGEG